MNTILRVVIAKAPAGALAALLGSACALGAHVAYQCVSVESQPEWHSCEPGLLSWKLHCENPIRLIGTPQNRI
jgi:hypothetical protein